MTPEWELRVIRKNVGRVKEAVIAVLVILVILSCRSQFLILGIFQLFIKYFVAFVITVRRFYVIKTLKSLKLS